MDPKVGWQGDEGWDAAARSADVRALHTPEHDEAGASCSHMMWGWDAMQHMKVNPSLAT